MLKRLLALTICLLFLSSVSYGAWLPGYGYRKKITIQGTNLDANLTHFPVLISVVDADIDDHCDDDGDRSYDIMLTQSDGSTELDINWLDYSEAGGNATIIAYVSDAGWTIESDGSTEIYLYYGNAAAGDPETDAGVWDASFKGVWHMKDLTISTITDSTGVNNGTKLDDNEPVEATGKIHKAQHFDGSDDTINCGNDASLELDTTGTVECWFKSDGNQPNDWNGLVVKNTTGSAGDKEYCLICDDDNANVIGQISDGGTIDDIFATYDYTDGNWHYICFRWDGSNLKLRVDTTDATPETQDRNAQKDGHPVHLGEYEGVDRHVDGLIDEARISTGSRADAWLEFNYANANEADNELSWGSEEESPSDDFVPKVIIIR